MMKTLRKAESGRRLYKEFYIVMGAFILAVLFIFGLLYGVFQNTLLHSVATLNNDFVRHVNSTASSAESILQNLSAQMFNLRSVQKMRTYSVVPNSDMIDGIRALNDFTASSTIIDSVYVYNGKQDYIYSTMTSGAVSDYATEFKDQAAVDLLKNRTVDQRLMPILRVSDVSTNTANREMYSIMMFDLGKDGRLTDNALMINIPTSWFSELYFGEDTEALIFTPDGGILSRASGMDVATGKQLVQSITTRLTTDSSGNFSFIDSNRSKKLCFYAKMNNRGWYYVRTVSYSKYLTGMMQMQKFIYIFLISVFLLTLIGTSIISFKVYFPFRHIRESLSSLEDQGNSDQSQKDPIEQLNNLISRSADSKRLNSTLRSMLRSEVIRSILLGQEKLTPECVKEYGFDFVPGQPITLLLFSSIRIEQISEIMHESGIHSECMELYGEYSVLLTQADLAALDKVCEQITLNHTSWKIIVGEPVANWSEINDAYEKLLECYRLRFLSPDEKIRYVSADIITEIHSAEIEMLIKAITDSLKNANRDGTEKAYKKFIESLTGQKYKLVRSSLVQLAHTISKFYYEQFPDNEPGYQAELTAFDKQLDSVRDIAEINSFFNLRFASIIDKIFSDKKCRQENLMNDILQKITDSFKDPNFSSQVLADEFDLSTAYLNRVFRHNQGLSLSEYVTNLRLSEAKRLLLETNIKVKEIGPLVGLENVQYFFVLFKQKFGLTPRQFRMGNDKEK